MKAQDRYPYDSATLGMNGIYQTIGNDSFYINSNFIASTGNVITVGKEYLLFFRPNEPDIKMFYIILVDCYYSESSINLIIQDIHSKGVYNITHQLECPENTCKWLLVSIDFIIDKLDKKIIQDYCGDCDNNKKYPDVHANPMSKDDLLEFEF
jgi:hypothetical protein